MPAGRRILETDSETATAALGARLGTSLCRGDVVALAGPIGSGKSVLARAAIRALMGDPELAVPSPSFTLVQTYEPADGPPVWHVDLYRVAAAEELIELGLEEAFETAVTLIEWPERAEDLLPAECLTVHFERCGEGQRRLVFDGPAPWPKRLAEANIGMEDR